MTLHQLRLVTPDPEPSIAADFNWQREPVFSQYENYFDIPVDAAHWDLFWQGAYPERARPISKKAKSKSESDVSLYHAEHFDVYEPHLVRSYAHRSAIATRIAKLRELSLASGDPFDEASAKLAQDGCEVLAVEIKPAIFLLPNGNIRALWRNEARESLGIQFLPDGDLQYVLLRRGRTKMLQTLGVEEDIMELASKVRSFRMERLWAHGKR